MYRKEVTRLIIECWGKGLSAEETREFITRKHEISVGLATIYRHRHSLTGQQMIDEIYKEQRRDIALEPNSEIRMNYRDKLLTKLIPAISISYNKTEIENKNSLPDLSKYSEEDKVAIVDAYRRINKTVSLMDQS